MGWIKRNLYFVISGALSLALMGLAGYFCYSKWSLNNDLFGQLQAAYDELQGFNNQKPHPGKPGNDKIPDNVKMAQDQQQQLRTYVQKARRFYQPITPIPPDAKINEQVFSSAISRTIAQLQHDATNASVSLRADQNGYNFSFEAERNSVSFASGSLAPLAVQLGEVKALCDILFAAKINALDNIRRERVSPDDSGAKALQSDYHNDKSITNELAVLTPYELKFRCFSTELAAVLSGLGVAPSTWIVKTINVEPAPITEVSANTSVTMAQPQYTPPPAASAVGAEEAFRMRYGMTGPATRYGGENTERYGAAGGGAGGIPYRPLTPGAPGYATPAPAPASPGAAPAGTAPRGALQTVLDEKPLSITMNVFLVKPLPSK